MDNHYLIDLDAVTKRLSTTEIDTLIMEDNLNSKVEAQKWCLGIGSDLKYHIEIDGMLYSVFSSGEDVELDAPTTVQGTASHSVVEEAQFMKQLGQSLKSTFTGLSVQQFATPMRRMRGAGGSGWTLHNTGEAIDLFYKNNNRLVEWLLANATQLELKVIIDYHNRRSWNSTRKTWRTSNSIDPSYGHIHIDRGGYRRTGQGLSPEETLKTGVRRIVGGVE